MADHGFKVIRKGFPIDSTEERNYVFWSKLATVKIFIQGSGTLRIPLGSSLASVDIAHGLSFVPMYLLYSQLLDGSGKWYLNRADEGGVDPDSGDQFVRGGFSGAFPGPYTEEGLYIDATNLHIEYGTYDDTVNHDIDYYYFIFGDKGGT